jgi:hypothetical protein
MDEHGVVRSRQTGVVEDSAHHSFEGSGLARAWSGVRHQQSDGAFGRELREIADRQSPHDHDSEDLPVLTDEVIRCPRSGAAGDRERKGARN